MVSSRIRDKAAAILRAKPRSEPNYYVNRYLTDDLGTAAQLEAGLRDHTSPVPTPPEVLERLLRAWRAMQPAAQEASTLYQVGGEWKAIVAEAFEPLTTALDAGDEAALDRLLRNFMRRFGDFFGEPTNFASEANQRARREQFRLYASRWIDLFGADSLREARVPLVGNPMGFLVDGDLYTADGLRHNFYAHRMLDLADDLADPIVCEVGGGFGGFARHLLGVPGSTFKYVDYDLPIICIASAYYLLTTVPDKRVQLYGEVDDLAEPLRDADVAVLPNFALPHLADGSVDICFNTCSFAEMEPATVQEYTRQFERVCRHFILYEDHSWSGDSKYAYYQPMGGFHHWDLSAIRPSHALFKRLYKVPAPFHSDVFGEFFEWLYERRRGATTT
jgi:putative sugar O-methyltransferase